LPRAIVPLWQLAQEPGVTDAWLNAAGTHAVVRWQASQDCVVATWFAVLARAIAPLWQLAQVPGATPRCSKRALENVAVLWHSSQPCVVGACEPGIGVAVMRAPGRWQPSHPRGVPLKMPRTWQDSHGTVRCEPVSA
jgi:hypothetical protein